MSVFRPNAIPRMVNATQPPMMRPAKNAKSRRAYLGIAWSSSAVAQDLLLDEHEILYRKNFVCLVLRKDCWAEDNYTSTKIHYHDILPDDEIVHLLYDSPQTIRTTAPPAVARWCSPRGETTHYQNIFL